MNRVRGKRGVREEGWEIRTMEIDGRRREKKGQRKMGKKEVEICILLACSADRYHGRAMVNECSNMFGRTRSPHFGGPTHLCQNVL